MGIKVEFNPDLALRNIMEYEAGNRRLEECIPENLEKGGHYKFLKEGQRNYWLLGEIPLVETEGYGRISRPVASIEILNVEHIVEKEQCENSVGEHTRVQRKIFTRGMYRVVDVYDLEDSTIHFEGFKKVKRR